MPDSTSCSWCGAPITHDPDDPPSIQSWCSSECSDAETADEPGWIKVEDLTPEQRAELDVLLSPAQRH